jgi:hypothetical protein
VREKYDRFNEVDLLNSYTLEDPFCEFTRRPHYRWILPLTFQSNNSRATVSADARVGQDIGPLAGYILVARDALRSRPEHE